MRDRLGVMSEGLERGQQDVRRCEWCERCGLRRNER